MKAGTLVKCINDNFKIEAILGYDVLPVEGCIYTVRDFYPADAGGSESIVVNEISNTIRKRELWNGILCSGEPSFFTWRFIEVGFEEMQEILEEELSEKEVFA